MFCILLNQIDYSGIWSWLVNNQASMASWFSSIGTVGAVIVALWQTRRSEKQKSPEIMMNIEHHGVYWWYYNNYKSGERWNTFNISNYGKTPANKLAVNLVVNKTSDDIRKWLEENNLNCDLKLKDKVDKLSEIKELNEISDLNRTIFRQDETKYKVEIQDYLFVDEKINIWFPREFKELYASIIQVIESKNLTKKDLYNLNQNRPMFYYHFQYKFQNNKGRKTIKVDPQFKFYNDTEKNKRMVKATYCITNN